MRHHLFGLVAYSTMLALAPAADRQVNAPRESQRDSGAEWVFSLAPRAFDPNPRVDFNVITEVTPAGKSLEQPTAKQPAYFELHPGGQLRLGQGATFNDKGPPVEQMQRVLVESLAQSHYLPAEGANQPPTILILFHWGSHTAITADDLQENPAQTAEGETEDGAETTAAANGGPPRAGVSRIRELIERAALVGGERFARDLVEALSDRGTSQVALQPSRRPVPSGMTPIPNVMGDLGNMFATDPLSAIERFKRSSKNNERLLEDAMGSIYFVLASAYDHQSVAQGSRTLLWRTKMTLNADGLAMSESLMPLITNAGPYFGREMRAAVVISKRIDREGSVEIGEPTVVEVIENMPENPPATEPAPTNNAP